MQKPSIDKLEERREQWIDAYDPSSLLIRCRVPILFVNGTNDVHYPLDSYQKSFDVVPGHKQMRIEVNMRHSHPAGWEPQEIGLFIDSFCGDEKPLALPGELTVDDDKILMTYTSAVPLKSAALHYTTDTGLRSKRVWQSLPAEIEDNVVTVAKPPAEANTWFIGERPQAVFVAVKSVNHHDARKRPFAIGPNDPTIPTAGSHDMISFLDCGTQTWLL